MAPQEMQKLISQSTLALSGYPSEEGIFHPNEHDGHGHVIVVQPDSSCNTAKRGGGKGKGSKKKGEDEPRNCVHLEAALFFFGIAGMIVSIMMLLQHLLIKYY